VGPDLVCGLRRHSGIRRLFHRRSAYVRRGFLWRLRWAHANCNGTGSHAPPIPFQLGTNFAFDSYALLTASSIEGLAGGYDGLLLKFRFYEADGVTPVLSYDPPLTDAPEPGTWPLAVLLLAGIATAKCYVSATGKSMHGPHVVEKDGAVDQD
jgi:hypothetical protein